MDTASPRVMTIVVNWNSGKHLRECLQSLKGQSAVIVVDNGSTDGSCAGIEELEHVTLLSTGRNLGFGAACNLGAAQTDSTYLLFLNPDARLSPNTLDIALAQMELASHAHVGICGVQLVDETSTIVRSCARFTTPLRVLAQSFGLDRLSPRFSHFMTDWPHDSTQEVDQVIGAFFLVRRDLFAELNGFDERFFVYYEEVDFSYRARQRGWKSLYLADTHAFHAGGGASEQIKAQRLFYSWRSRLLYVNKHFGCFGFLTVLLATLLLEPFSRSVLAVVRRSGLSFNETWQACGLLLAWLPVWWRKGVTG